MCMVDYCGFGRTLLFWWSKENWCFWGTNRFDFTPCKTDGLKYILYLLWINTWVQLLHLGNDGIKLLLVRRMRQTSIEANSVSLVNGEADGAAVVEGVEYSTIGEVGSETTLLEHLAGESVEDEMEGFVEEHCLRL